METHLKLAVLIDGDNIPSAYVKEMMEEIAKYGNPTIKRIYGDWTKPNLQNGKIFLLENAITPIQQYGYTVGKNATDSAMIIDAMDILYSEKVNGFCLVSSDSDFTRLGNTLARSWDEGISVSVKRKLLNHLLLPVINLSTLKFLKINLKNYPKRRSRYVKKSLLKK